MKKTINGVEYDIKPFANLRGANLRYSNLSGSDLSGSDLSGANLSGANLRYSNLSGSKLYGSNLRGVDFNGADLSGANLDRADMFIANLSGICIINCIGNGKEIVTIQTKIWKVCYTVNDMSIGCCQFPIKIWFDFTDEEIARMDEKALEFSKKWKPILKLILEIE